MKEKMSNLCHPCAFMFALFALTAVSVKAQDLDNLSFKKGVKINGSIGASMVNYAASGIQNRRDPLNWFLNGNLNVNLFGFDMPFTFSVANASRSYTQPFNQMRIAPKYKWIKAYVGTASMNFSPYTLAGHMFNGSGVELTPGKWNISAMYGTLQKAVAYDEAAQNFNDIAYKRTGYGLKVGYNDRGDSYSVSFFTAKDNPASLQYIPPEAQKNPMQNVAVSAAVKKMITKKIFADVEYAVSALNTNDRSKARADSGQSDSRNLLGFLLKPNGTTQYFDAINAGIGYNASWYTLQIRYERVAPQYQTLGAYYFNNDFRNITIAPGVRLLKNRLSINANVGIQQNNLDNTRSSTTKRFVGNLTANMAISQKWNVSGTYSNFSTYTNMKPQTDPFFRNPLDTLNFYQLTNNLSGSTSYSFGNKESVKMIMGTIGYQKANEQSRGEQHSSSFINGNIGYTQTMIPKNMTVGGSFNYNTNNVQQIRSVYWGPNVNVTKGFLQKQIKANAGVSYNVASSGGQSSGGVLNTRIGCNYSPQTKSGSRLQGKHNLGLNLSYLNRMKGSDDKQSAYSEITSTLNYTYSF